MDRLLALVGDRRNVAGMGGATVGLALLFAGVIGPWWGAIVGGLYAAGWLGAQLVPRSAPPDPARIDAAALPAALRRLAGPVAPELPRAAKAHLDRILDAADSLAPKLAALGPASLALIPVRQLLGTYIPTTLRTYAALPRRVRGGVTLSDGATAETRIVEQLALLDAQMDEVAANLAADDLLALETQGRFLAERFKPSDFTPV